MRYEIHFRIIFRLCGHISFIAIMPLRNFSSLQIIRHYQTHRLVLCVFNSLCYHVRYIRSVQDHLRTVVIDEQRQLPKGKLVICQVDDRTDLPRSDICKAKFRAVRQYRHDHIVFAYAILAQRMCQLIRLLVQLRIRPASICRRIYQRSFLAISSHISHEAVEPGVLMLKGFDKHLVIVCSHKIPSVLFRSINHFLLLCNLFFAYKASRNPFILNRFLHYIIAFFVCQSNSDKIAYKSVIKEPSPVIHLPSNKKTPPERTLQHTSEGILYRSRAAHPAAVQL